MDTAGTVYFLNPHAHTICRRYTPAGEWAAQWLMTTKYDLSVTDALSTCVRRNIYSQTDGKRAQDLYNYLYRFHITLLSCNRHRPAFQ
jgi:hypothetical protein